MKLLLDTNVLIDYITKRNENHIPMGKIINSCVQGENTGYVTSHSITDLFYVTRKYIPNSDRKEWTKFVVNTFTILTEDKKVFDECLKAEHFDDLEDQLQMESAAEANLDYVITENIKDFDYSKVQVITCKEFLEKK